MRPRSAFLFLDLHIRKIKAKWLTGLEELQGFLPKHVPRKDRRRDGPSVLQAPHFAEKSKGPTQAEVERGPIDFLLPDRSSCQPVVGIGNVDQVHHELGSVHLDVESPSAATAAGQTCCTGTIGFQREDIEARMVFTSQVLAPAMAGNEGIDHLWVLCDSWLAHIEHRVFPGGYFFTGAFFECAERSGAIEKEINGMALEWWTSLKSAVLKAQDRKELDPATDPRRISFDLNGILLAAYWAFLVEKDTKIFREARIAVLAKLERLATPRIPASAFESEDAWKEYIKGKRVQEKKKLLDALRGLVDKKAQSSAISPSIQPPKKSKSVLDNLKRLTKS